jgi:ribosome-associated translation inhibitor RaiA
MRITISARHCEVTPALQARARDVAERLAGLSPHALDATVVFDRAGLNAAVELRLHARGRKLLVGVGEGRDHRTALDRAEAKLRPQLVRAGEARQRARRPGTRTRAR